MDASCPSRCLQDFLARQIRLSHLRDSLRRSADGKEEIIEAERERRVRAYLEIMIKTEAKIRDAVEHATILEEGFAESWDEKFYRHLGPALSEL